MAKNNPDTHREYNRGYRRGVRLRAIAILGGRCARCGFDDERALQFDHVNGGGYAERQAHTSSTAHIARRIIAGEREKYQVLCANCNWIKRTENGEKAGYLSS